MSVRMRSASMAGALDAPALLRSARACASFSLLAALAGCGPSEPPAGVFKGQIQAHEKAKAVESMVQQGAEARDKQLREAEK